MRNKLIEYAVKSRLFKNKAFEKMRENTAQSALDTAIICLIAIVLGALILAGLYALIDGEVMPTLSQKIKDMFNYTN